MATPINSTVVLSALTKYIDQLGRPEIMTEIVLSGRTAKIVNKQTGVKYQQAINYMTSQLLWQATQCGNAFTSATGSVTLNQQIMTVTPVSIIENVCLVGAGSMEQYWTGMLMTKGSYQEKLTPDVFAKAYVSDKIMKIQDSIEKAIWLGIAGGTNSVYPNLNWTNGFVYQLEQTGASASVIIGNPTWSGPMPISTSSSDLSTVNFVNGLFTAIPENVSDQPDLTLFMSISNFRNYILGMQNLNRYDPTFFSVNPDGANTERLSWSYLHPGTNLRVVGTSGLLGSNKMVASPASIMFVGTDNEGEEEQFEIWFSQDYNAIGFRSQFKLGTNIVYPQYVVEYKG
jgi:hypothetical protein